MAKKNFSLIGFRDLMRRELAAAQTADASMMTQDIAARAHEAAAGEAWAFVKDELATKGIKPDEWCRKNLAVTARSTGRRLFLSKHWKLYETARREHTDSGLYGLVHAVTLVQQALAVCATKRHQVTKHSAIVLERPVTLEPARCDFRTGDALAVLKTLPADYADCCVTSPPYFGSLRQYGDSDQAGHEGDVEAYVATLVDVFREARRVLCSNGTLWLVMGDAFAGSGSTWGTTSGLHARRGKIVMGQEVRKLPPGYKAKDLILIGSLIATALQQDGWWLRNEIVWYKKAIRPENVSDRFTRTHEKVYVFSKSANYRFNQDVMREPAIRQPDASGAIRRDYATGRVWIPNPMGRNGRDVWEICTSNYRGQHPATFPVELARRCILASCPPQGMVLDCFGGAGTTALAALQLGHRAITIDLNPAFTMEAEARIADADTEVSAAEQMFDQSLEQIDDHDTEGSIWRGRAEALADELERVCARFGYRSEVLASYQSQIGQRPLMPVADAE